VSQHSEVSRPAACFDKLKCREKILGVSRHSEVLRALLGVSRPAMCLEQLLAVSREI